MLKPQIFINLPVIDLARATAFYEALGFVKNPMFSNEHASGLAWSDDVALMLLTHDFYKQFPRNRAVAYTHTTSAVLLALQLDSKEAVQRFADTARANGGDYYKVTLETGMPEDAMFGYEVEDLDGHIWEPMWMNPEHMPSV